MVVRRIRQHVVTHDWFAVAIDVAIVIVGVFLAMQANNWNEVRLDRERTQSYHARLIEDLRATEQGARASAAYYGDVRSHALAALSALDRPPRSLGAPFLVDAYQATQIFPRFAQRATYDEILASGNADLIGSAALRERLTNFYWRLEGLMTLVNVTPPYRERLRSVMPYSAQASIRASCDEILTDNGKGLVTARLPKNCAVVMDPRLVADAVAQIHSTPGLKNDLTRAVIDLDQKLLQFGKLQDNALQLRERMVTLR